MITTAPGGFAAGVMVANEQQTAPRIAAATAGPRIPAGGLSHQPREVVRETDPTVSRRA
jgi:hypothetical protein